MQDGSLVAAVDLGSNSFRMEVGRIDHGDIIRVDYIKETVRQGAGLDEQRHLTPEAMARGWECLARFGERLAGFDPSQVRAVATQTLREARNRDAFLDKGQKLLGFPIEVIAGREEARLIYQGVARKLGLPNEHRLVVDIGGRSTELIAGVGDRAEVMESYRVGSVAWADKYFPQGRLRAEEFDSAIVAAKAVLDEAAVHFIAHSVAPQVAVYGSAGTIGAIAEILVASGRSQGVIDLAGLHWLRMQMQSFAQIQTLDMPGLKEDRKPVLGGGLSVLIALFELLGLTGMRVVDAGLRHGVLHDLIDRELPGTDVREQSALRLAKRFGIDALQAQRVEEAATHLFEPMLAGSGEDASNTLRYRRKLSWAARLHEVGLTISHSDYHKHGAYIIDHTDALGFSQQELHRLSLLVLGHRGKLRKLEADFSDIRFVQQLICLRLGVLLCHARIQPSLKGLRLRCNAVAQRFEFSHSAAWAEKFPQSLHLLQHEQQAWLKTSWNLTIAAE